MDETPIVRPFSQALVLMCDQRPPCMTFVRDADTAMMQMCTALNISIEPGVRTVAWKHKGEHIQLTVFETTDEDADEMSETKVRSVAPCEVRNDVEFTFEEVPDVELEPPMDMPDEAFVWMYFDDNRWIVTMLLEEPEILHMGHLLERFDKSGRGVSIRIGRDQ